MSTTSHRPTRRALRTIGCARFTEPHGDASLRLRQARIVRRVYREVHGAQVDTLMPWLMSLHGDRDAISGVVGARAASHERLFLEHYLDRPIEVELGEAAGRRVWRDELVEVGNLAAVAPGTGRLLISSLAALIDGSGGRWAVFTATHALRGLFARMSVDLVDIGPADGRRLGAEALARWGAYYDTAPRVSAARIADVRAASAADVSSLRLGAALWRRSHLHGCRLALGSVA